MRNFRYKPGHIRSFLCAGTRVYMSCFSTVCYVGVVMAWNFMLSRYIAVFGWYYIAVFGWYFCYVHVMDFFCTNLLLSIFVILSVISTCVILSVQWDTCKSSYTILFAHVISVIFLHLYYVTIINCIQFLNEYLCVPSIFRITPDHERR